MLNPKEILKKSNYYISYDYLGNNKATVFVSFKKLSYNIHYKNGFLYNTFDNSRMKMPLYAASPFVEIIIDSICEENGYGNEFLIHTIGGSKVSHMRFGDITDPNDEDRADLFYDLYKDIWHFGVKPEHVELAREGDVYVPFQRLIKYYLGVSIGN